MRVLVMGASGMLGHKLYQVLSERFDVFGTFSSAPPDCGLYDTYKTFSRVRAQEAYRVDNVLRANRPDVVINAIGITKQKLDDIATATVINAIFPHALAGMCQRIGARLVHVSTDCVFSGNKGNYTEQDRPDPVDAYGQTKLLGELKQSGCLTIRTSIIGRELRGRYGLLEWFLSNQGKTVKGYRRAIFSGLTTRALAKVIGSLIAEHRALSGLYHIASESIDKYSLLIRLRAALDLDIDIEPYANVQCDRSLCANQFIAVTGYEMPTWQEMIDELVVDVQPYDGWRHDVLG